MLSTAANPSPFDPLDRMPADEPRFVIRGADPAGPGAITEWSRLRRNWAFRTYGIDATGDAKRLLDAELLQCKEAEELALDWKEIQTGGATAETDAKATYNDVALSEEQIARAKRQKDMEAIRSHLREAAFHAAEIVEADDADALECFAPILASLNVINQLADGLDAVKAG